MIQLYDLMALILWLVLITYILLGGATFGATIWDLLTYGKQAKQQRLFINQSIGPVWEIHHLWLLLYAGIFVAFPVAFLLFLVVFFVPYLLILLGLVLRWTALIFHLPALQTMKSGKTWSRIFRVSSLLAPFLLGASAAVVASGQISFSDVKGLVVPPSVWTSWTIPFACVSGAVVLSLCALLAAVYLTVKAEDARDAELTDLFRRRAIAAEIVTALLTTLGLILAPSESPILWNGMTAWAITMLLIAILFWLLAVACLVARYYRRARVRIILETAFLLGCWGVAQWPYLLPPDVTVSLLRASDRVLEILLLGMALCIAALLLLCMFLSRVLHKQKPKG
jgi:cytochrome d ubiquinol oxidase subunit II